MIIISINNSTASNPVIITPAATTNNTLATVNKLTQNVTDPNYKQLEKQMETQLHSGDIAGAQQTLSLLKSFLFSGQGRDISPAVRDLLNSLRFGSSGGLMFDTGTANSLDALRQESQGITDPQYNNLLSQFQTRLQNGDTSGAQQTLAQLKGLVDTGQVSGMTSNLADLIKSLSLGDNGLGVDPGTDKTLATLDKVSEGVTDPHFNQLKSQLESQLHNGDNVGAQQTLGFLKNYIDTGQIAGMTPTLRDLVKSLELSPAGLGVNSQTLKSLIGSAGLDGLPAGLSGMDKGLAASDLQAFSGLLSNVDPGTAGEFAKVANQLIDFGGLPGGIGNVPKLPSINYPKTSGLGGIGSGLSSFHLPMFSLSTPGLLGGAGDPTLLLVLIAVLSSAIILVVLHKKGYLVMLRKRVAPYLAKIGGKAGESGLRNPRDTVIYYFGKTVSTMDTRGVPRLRYETHREFSSKCSPRPEAPPVAGISTLYEKAMFSGQEVTQPDADEAQQYAHVVDTIDEETSEPEHSESSDRSIS